MSVLNDCYVMNESLGYDVLLDIMTIRHFYNSKICSFIGMDLCMDLVLYLKVSDKER